MTETRWYSKITKTRTSDTFLLGIWFVKNTNAWGYPNMHLTVAIGGNRWRLWFYEASKHTRPTKPDKPSPCQKVLCFTGILGLQALFNWMDVAPIDDLLVAAAMLGLLTATWVAYRLTRRRHDRNPR